MNVNIIKKLIFYITDQQQIQPARQQLSLCGTGGIGSMITDENSVFVDPSVSSVIPDPLSESSLPTTTNSFSTSSSSAPIVKSLSVPLLYFLWLWGLFFYNQCSIHCLFGIASIVEYYFRDLCTFYTGIIELFFVKFNPPWRLYFHACYFSDQNHIHGRCNFIVRLSVSLNLSTVSILVTKNDIVIAEQYLRKGYQRYYYYYCYRWWLWPSRWKTYFILNKLSFDRFCYTRVYCCRWCYWRWLWPYRWKGKVFKLS
jgi:hypothetical protein